MSGLVNKVKEALHSDKHAETGTHATHNAPEGTHGPHSSRTANAADPRVDSDRDHRAAPGTFGGASTGTHGAQHTTGYNDPEGVHGTHNSRLANAADPRIDSDRDHRGAPGTHGVGHTTHSTHTGPHTGGAGVTGYNDPAGTHGPHGSRVANAADPRFDSDRDHRGAPGSAGTAHYGSGPGPAPNTAGPHNKDMLNKVDPRVDSDLDGSKTVGGNKTLG